MSLHNFVLSIYQHLKQQGYQDFVEVKRPFVSEILHPKSFQVDFEKKFFYYYSPR